MYNIHSQVSSSSPKVIYYNTDVTNPVHTLLCEVYTNIIYIRELFAVFSSPIKVASIIKGEFELHPRKHIVHCSGFACAVIEGKILLVNILLCFVFLLCGAFYRRFWACDILLV